MVTARMEATSRTRAVWGLLAVAVVAGVPAVAAASYYGEGSFFGDEYYSLADGTQAGGGACVNCDGGSSGSSGGSKTSSTETASTAATSSPVTATTTSSTPFRCAETGAVTGELSGAGLVNLLVSLGIIPSGKAKTACDALMSEASTPMGASADSFRFTVPLRKGERSPEVRRLQQFLNTHGFAVASGNELGAAGHETDLFGLLTEDAVKRFQAAYAAEILAPVGLTTSSGFFGPSSMKKANALLSGA